MTFPDDKLAELLVQVIEFQNKQRATKKQLQRLAGKLNWADRVVYGDRTFLRRILDTMNALSPSGKFRLDQSFRDDVEWWVHFFKVFNGTRLFLDDLPTIDVATEACPIAAGGYFRGDWFYHNFELDSPRWQNLHINHKETLAIIYSDNQAAVQMINKGTTASAIIMQELRGLFWLSAFYNFHISAVCLQGAKNTLADSISSMHEPKGLFSFYSFLCDNFTPAFANAVQLARHTSVHGRHLISCRLSKPDPGGAT